MVCGEATYARSQSVISRDTLCRSFFMISLSDAHQFSEVWIARTLALYSPSFWGVAEYSMYALRLDATTVAMAT